VRRSCKPPTAVYLSSGFYIIKPGLLQNSGLLYSCILFLVCKDLEKTESIEARSLLMLFFVFQRLFLLKSVVQEKVTQAQ